jgi:hypothetical protein
MRYHARDGANPVLPTCVASSSPPATETATDTVKRCVTATAMMTLRNLQNPNLNQLRKASRWNIHPVLKMYPIQHAT